MAEEGAKEMLQSLIFEFCGKDRIFAIPKIFIEMFKGDFSAAILLNQIIFWSGKSKLEGGWFYKSYPEWREELYLTENVVRRICQVIQSEGLLETKVKKVNGVPKLHYRVNTDKMEVWFSRKLMIAKSWRESFGPTPERRSTYPTKLVASDHTNLVGSTP